MSTNGKFLLESFEFGARLLHTGELRLIAAGTELELGENIVDSYGKVRKDCTGAVVSPAIYRHATQAGGNAN